MGIQLLKAAIMRYEEHIAHLKGLRDRERDKATRYSLTKQIDIGEANVERLTYALALVERPDPERGGEDVPKG